MSTISKLSGMMLCLGLIAGSVANVNAADNCKPVNREQSIKKVLNANAGSKVLKVVEKKDDKGCPQLVIRILVDGMVKAINVKG